MTGCGRWSTGNCARCWCLTIRTNGISITKNLSWRMWCTNLPGILRYRRLDLVIINKKKSTWRIEDFAVPADQRLQLKESEKKDMFLDVGRELKKLCNMKVTIIPTLIGTDTKRLVQELEDLETRVRVKSILTIPLMRSVWILRRVLETWGELLSLKFPWETII